MVCVNSTQGARTAQERSNRKWSECYVVLGVFQAETSKYIVGFFSYHVNFSLFTKDFRGEKQF